MAEVKSNNTERSTSWAVTAFRQWIKLSNATNPVQRSLVLKTSLISAMLMSLGWINGSRFVVKARNLAEFIVGNFEGATW